MHKTTRLGNAFSRRISQRGMWLLMTLLVVCQPRIPQAQNRTYTVVDTNQTTFYDGRGKVTPAPAESETGYGQDACYIRNAPAYKKSSDGKTVQDLQTGLTWTQAPDTNQDGYINSNDKLSWKELRQYPASMNTSRFGGYSDWRIPTIKELYSLMDFRGTDPRGYRGADASRLTPFIDTEYFAFGFGDTAAGERIIDAQYWSATEYVSTTMQGAATVFGVNFADGRIKGYPRDRGRRPGASLKYALLVRGNPQYGKNDFQDNQDGTITDKATGLIWQKADSAAGMDWMEALEWAEDLELAGHSDWRLPSAKELQSIVDYSRAPDTTGTPAINPLFDCTPILNETGTRDFPAYWTSTTHAGNRRTPGDSGVYICFGRGMGYMFGQWIDVHGAGCQRSEPKTGNPEAFPKGRGPQGDAIRILNFVRCVRDIAHNK